MQTNASTDLFRLLISKDFEVKTLSAVGKEVVDIEEAEMFSFDYDVNGNNYGPVVILLNDNSELELFYGDNVGKSMEGEDKREWMNFLYQLRTFAKRNLLGFKLNDISKLKYSMQGMAAIKEGLFEGYTGTRKTSYSPAGKARIIIKHTRPIGEGEKRYYNIGALFVENADGERFKLPFKKLAGARAMARHVESGGNPYDVFGVHISEMVKEINTLSGFMRRAKMFEEDEETGQYVMAGREHLDALRKKLKSLSGRRGYSLYKEQWTPADVSEEEETVDRIRAIFTEKTINDKIDEALPLLARIAAQNTQPIEEEMPEVDEFKNWADGVTEGTWAVPDSEDAIEELREFMSTEQPVGIDAMDASDKLYSLIGDDKLFDDLSALADNDPQADSRPIVMAWLKANMPHIVPQLTPTSEGLAHELDADDETQLNASHNKMLDKKIKETAFSVHYDLDQLSPELRNAIADGLVSVYDLLNDAIGFKPGKNEMDILQRAYQNVANDIGSDDYDTICDVMTDVIEETISESADAQKEEIRESMDSLTKMGPGIVTNELQDLIQRTRSILND